LSSSTRPLAVGFELAASEAKGRPYTLSDLVRRINTPLAIDFTRVVTKLHCHHWGRTALRAHQIGVVLPMWRLT
jgi:hypothetical protein